MQSRIQRLLDGLIFFGKGLGMHAQREFQLIYEKNEGKLGTLFTIMIWCQLIFFFLLKYNVCTTYTFTFGKCLLIEKC